MFTNTNKRVLQILNADYIESNLWKKKRSGYKIYGFHSYYGSMFSRENWWPKIGIDSMLFYDESIGKRKSEIVNSSSPFVGYDDQWVLKKIFSQNFTSKKTIHYFLTLNTHLPYSYKGNTDSIKGTELITNKAICDQYAGLSDLFYSIGHEMKANPKYDLIFIKGDHMPPFIFGSERSYFYEDYIPYIIALRK
jgi:phosphoglycerol transferase MdoB-like AlkP superfamily enzyme